MKNYIIRGMAKLADAGSAEVCLGYVEFDGGWPYVSELPTSHHDFEAMERHLQSYTRVAGKDMHHRGMGMILFPLGLGTFNHAYREKHPLGSTFEVEIKIRLELIELDYSDAMNVKSKLLQAVTITGRESASEKNAPLAYYDAAHQFIEDKSE